jgi:hypothetical protein
VTLTQPKLGKRRLTFLALFHHFYEAASARGDGRGGRAHLDGGLGAVVESKLVKASGLVAVLANLLLLRTACRDVQWWRCEP